MANINELLYSENTEKGESNINLIDDTLIENKINDAYDFVYNIKNQELPFIHISEFNDSLRRLIANKIYDMIELISDLYTDKDRISLLKEKGIIFDYICHSDIYGYKKRFKWPWSKIHYEKNTIRLFSTIDDKILLELEAICKEKSILIYKRKFCYYIENGVYYLRTFKCL